jgi:uncharacterized membrane protein
MARDVQDTLRDVLRAVENAGSSGNGRGRSGNGPLSGVKGVAAGAGAAALVPLAVKGAGRLAKGGLGDIVHAPQHALHDATSKLGSNAASKVGDLVNDKVEEAGGPSGILKGTLKDALPFGGSDDDDDDQGGRGGGKNDVAGVGKGRRMPVQQSVDIGVNIETVYNQFTQFEDWPTFMHRVTNVSQEDDCTVSFATKIWTRKREFTAKIETQRPNERIKWKVSQGLTHTGVVTFHELGPNLTRVLMGMDVQPGGMIEKLARGMRNVKRAARADLHRFKALIEMSEQETGAWRGVIEDGEVVEEHDPGYDESRDYADLDEITAAQEQDDEEQDDEQQDDEQQDDEQQDDADQEDEQQDDEEEEQPRQRRGRAQSRSAANSSGSQSRSSRSGGQSRSSRSGGQSRSSNSGSSSSRSRNGNSGGSSRSRAGASSGGQSRQRQSRSRNSHSE